MCGITGYAGKRNASNIVFEGLKKLEYRGYDSWGIAIQKPDLLVVKKTGKISESKDIFPESRLAIGHSRWATHGGVSERNAHPHRSCDGKIAVVHNGIVENFQKLRNQLVGHKFLSETDTEVIPHLIEENIHLGLLESARLAAQKLEGRYAFIAMEEGTDKIVAARKGSPLVIGISPNGTYVSSDVTAFLGETNRAIFLKDNQIASINSSIHLHNLSDGEPVTYEETIINWNQGTAEKGDFEHFMLKEIMEQDRTLISASKQNSTDILKARQFIRDAKSIFITGAGTAGTVCQLGQYLFSKLLSRRAMYVPAGEFENYSNIMGEEDVLMVVSQSGETADALEAISTAKNARARIISLVNVPGSTITRESDITFLINAGPEKAVCSTKATTAQIAVLILLCKSFAGEYEKGKDLIVNAASAVKEILSKNLNDIISIAEQIFQAANIYIIGRGLHYPVALESAIKIQEISYIHAQAFAGGELKHGPIALIEKGTVCIALVPEDETKTDMLSNILELKARGAKILVIGQEPNQVYDWFIHAPTISDATPISTLVPIQLLAYYLALKKGNNPDYPRNLAKSVTVK